MFKLKLIAGGHRLGPVYESKDGRRFITQAGTNLNPGAVFESPIDLSIKYPEKFARLDSVAIVEEEQNEEDEEYAGMSMDDLKKLALELEIKVPSNISKATLITKIKEAAAG